MAPFGLPTGFLGISAVSVSWTARCFAIGWRAAASRRASSCLVVMISWPCFICSPAFADLLNLFPGGVLGTVTAFLFQGPFDQLIMAPLETGFVTVQPQETFTVMFDLATYSQGSGGVVTGRGHGSAYFLNTLSAAPDFFVGIDGNPVTGIEAIGPSPAPEPPLTTLTLTPATATNPVGATHTVNATATDSTGAPVPEVVVKFEVISGPNMGLVGGGYTDQSGQATFAYESTNGTGDGRDPGPDWRVELKRSRGDLGRGRGQF